MGLLRVAPSGQDTYFVVEAAVPRGLYRVFARGEREDLLLGVWEGGPMRRHFSRELTAPAGRIVSGLVYPVGSGEIWTEAAAEHFPGWPTEGGLCRRQGKLWQLALPFEPDGPFPLPTLFCLACVRQIDGRQWAVFCFDRDGHPIFPPIF